jgi:alpha-tubulin suppressor-like RCC1 family protein
MTTPSGYKFPILDSSGNPTSTVVDMADMFVSKDIFLMSGLWACGYNQAGNLGNGTVVLYSSPIQVGSLTNWKQVDTAYGVTLAVKTDGTLWGWGYNTSGQLGNGSSAYYSSPIQIGALTNWKQVSSQSYSSATHAIKTDGTLWAWGYNASGQLGNGTNVNYSSPIQVGSLTNWKTVDNQHFIKTDGTLWACGYGASGRLGNGSSAYYSSPIQIGALTNWKQVSSRDTVLAVKTDGTLWGWGFGTNGVIGNGFTSGSISPVQIGTLTNWKQVCLSDTAGQYPVAMAVKTDGTLWGWGLPPVQPYNNLNYASPVQIGALTNWKQVTTSSAAFVVSNNYFICISSPDLPT